MTGPLEAEGPISEDGAYSIHNPTLVPEGGRTISLSISTTMPRRDSRRSSGLRSVGQGKTDEGTNKAGRRREEAASEIKPSVDMPGAGDEWTITFSDVLQPDTRRQGFYLLLCMADGLDLLDAV